MGQPSVDRQAARALLVERGLSVFEADEFLMRSLLTATEAATVLGVKDSRAARDTLRRWGVHPIGRGPGRTGENTYPAELVWLRHQNRPGRGWRKGQSTATQQEGTTMSIAPATPPETNEPWYADHHEVISLTSILVDAEWLDTPREVIYFFEDPWKWGTQYKVWAAAGRPRHPSADDLAQARLLGSRGTLRRELERRHRDDTARWEEFLDSLNASRNSLPILDQTGAHHPCVKTPAVHRISPVPTPNPNAEIPNDD